MARVRREDWLDQGLRVLREGGENALTIDRLCADLGRTKGSFYHHFRDVQAYLDALLEHWEASYTSALIRQADAAPERRRALGEAVRALDMKLDLAVRAWGLRDPRAAAFVARVDERRVGYLAGLYGDDVAAARRLELARLEYAAFIGTQQLYPDLSTAGARALVRTLRRALEQLSR